MNPEDPTLEDALDGAIAAANYCDEIGEAELARILGTCYQLIGDVAPEEDWD